MISYPLLFIIFSFTLANGAAVDNALCGFIAATSVQSVKTMWSCSTNGLTSNDPCTWSSVVCTNDVVVSIVLNGLQLTGKYYLLVLFHCYFK